MSDAFDEIGLIRPELQAPPPSRPQRREPAATPEAPSWPFDERKLLALREQAHRVSLTRRDASDRLREAQNRLATIRSDISADEFSYGATSQARLQQKAHAESEVARLRDELATLDTKANSALGTARACEQWARTTHNWTIDGQPRGVDLPPAVAGAES